MKKLCMIYCYMGKWPEYLPLFLESCKYNPTVDFLLFTDCPRPEGRSENVKIIPVTLAEFNTLASLRLDMEIEVTLPYKLCDFKPIYGYIFEDYIKEYEYWGYGDIDVVFGNIRKFITDEILENHDVITCGKGFLFGHFTILRNSFECNRLFEHSFDLNKALQEEKYISFDECHSWNDGGIPTLEYLLNGGYLFDGQTVIESFTHIVQRLSDNGELKVYSKHLFRDGYPIGDHSRARYGHGEFSFTYQWEKGKIIDVETREEFLYLHLYNLKHNDIYQNLSQWNEFPNKYIISKMGLRENQEFSEEEQQKLTQNYCWKYFPRTSSLLSKLIPDLMQELFILFSSEDLTYREHLTDYFLNYRKTFPISIQQRLNEIFDLENLKLDLIEIVYTFSHFTFNLPRKEHLLGMKGIDPDSEYTLHPETKLLQTKWNWDLTLPHEEFMKNLESPSSQFHVVLSPSYSEVSEKHFPKFVFDLVKKFNRENTLRNILNTYKNSEVTVSAMENSPLEEIEIKKLIREFVLSGLLLMKRKTDGSLKIKEEFEEIKLREQEEIFIIQELKVMEQQIQELVEVNSKMKNALKWYEDTFEYRNLLGIVKDRIMKRVEGVRG